MKQKTLTIVLLLAISTSLFAIGKYETLVVKSSTVCQMCKEAIESGLSEIEGIRASVVMLGNKEVRVKYNPAIISEQQIRSAITKLGYDADKMMADDKAYSNLPACCKKDSKCGDK